MISWFDERKIGDFQDRAAFFYNGSSWSRKRLDVEAAKVAGFLLDRGAEKGTLKVATLMGNSMEMLAVILGVWRSGNVWVPLEKSAGPAFNRSVLDACGVRIVVADESCIDEYDGALTYDEIPAGYHKGVETLEQDLAYIIHTSGTTGKPKGVCVSHGALQNYLSWAHTVYPNDHGHTWAVFTSPGVDLGLTSLFLPVFGESNAVYYGDCDVQMWIEGVAKCAEVNAVKCTPSHLRYLKALGARVPHWNCCVVGGEALTPDLVDWLFECNQGMLVVNEYGPAECTVGCSAHVMRAEMMLEEIPIGKPISNVRFSLKNPEKCKEGTRGILCVSGACVANGYFQEESSKFSKGKSLRASVYNTGDLVEVRDVDGDDLWYFLGREDEQIKINGFRVEKEAITAHFKTLPQVADAEVFFDGHELTLSCFLVPEKGQRLDETDCRVLSRELQPHARPSRFYSLDHLPYKLNGKIDINAARRFAVELKSEAEVKETKENALKRIWSAILSQQQIDYDTHFFRAGGRSMDIPVLVGRIRELFGLRCPINLVYQNPVFLNFCAAIEELGSESNDDHAVSNNLGFSSNIRRLFRFYRHWRAKPDSRDHSSSALFTLKGDLTSNQVHQALRALAERYPELKRNIRFQRGKLIILEGKWEFEYCHSYVPLSDGVNELLSSFDLEEGPCVRMTHFRNGQHQSEFLLDIHHALCDAVALKWVIQDFMSLVSGEELCPRDMQNARTYTGTWELDQLRLDECQNDSKRWARLYTDKSELSSIIAKSNKHSAQKGDRFEKRQMLPNTAGYLQAHAAAHGTSISRVMLGAFVFLLQRYFSQRPVRISSFHSVSLGLRNDIVGCGVEQLVLEFSPSKESDYNSVIEALNARLEDALQNDLFKFDQINEFLLRREGIAAHESCDAAFIFQPLSDLKPVHAKLGKYDLNSAPLNNFPISLEVQVDKSVELIWHFDADIHSDAVNSLTSMYESFLGQLSKDVVNPVFHFDYDHADSFGLNVSENTRLTSLRSLVTVLKKTAIEMGSRVAVRDKRGQLSYADLDDASDRISSYINSRSYSGRQQSILVSLDPGPLMLAAVFGIWKSGNIYVPITKDLPRERVLLIQQISNAKLLLGSGDLDLGPQVSTLDEQKLNALISTDENASTSTPMEPEPESIAYVLFTSGTTGQPKGVPIKHRSLTNFIMWQKEYLGLSQDTVFAQRTSMLFDVSLLELFGALPVGGQVYCCDRLFDPDNFAKELMRSEATVLSATPAMFKPLLTHLMRSHVSLKNLRSILLAGEVFPVGLAQNAVRFFGESTRVYNLYGPTEATIAALACDVSSFLHHKELPIGRPIFSTKVCIVNKDQRVCPPGVIGEVCLSGQGLFEDYLNGSLEGENQFIELDGKRFYRTSDLGMQDRQGYVWFKGRQDRQVKRNGYRIELSDIEANILSIDGAQDAVVLLKQEKIWAFVKVSHAAVGISEYASLLRKRLPAYMLPDHWIRWSEDWPVTRNGKLDQEQLFAQIPQSALSPSQRADCNEVERVVLELASSVLNRSLSDLDADFFELGGNSLDTILFSDALQYDLGIPISGPYIYQLRTLRAIAAFISSFEHGSNDGVTSFVFGSEETAVFAFPPAFGSGAIFEPLAHLFEGGMRAFNFCDRNDLIQAYANAIICDERRGQVVTFLGYSGGGNIAFKVAELCEKSGVKVKHVIMLDSWRKRGLLSALTGDFKTAQDQFLEEIKDKYMAFPHILDRRTRQVESYYRYLNLSLKDFEGTIAANILHIGCTRSTFSEMKDGTGADMLQGWNDSTSGKLLQRQVDCEHNELLSIFLLETVSAIEALLSTNPEA